MLLCLFMVVTLKWVWQLRHHNVPSRPCNNAVFLQYAGLRCFVSSLLGLLTKHLGDPASVSEESVRGVRRVVWQSCSAGTAVSPSSPPPAVQKPAPGSECCCANVLRADGKRTMLWKNWIFSWICCSRTEWVSYTFWVFLESTFRGQQPFMTGDLVLLFACFHVQGLMSLWVVWSLFFSCYSLLPHHNISGGNIVLYKFLVTLQIHSCTQNTLVISLN